MQLNRDSPIEDIIFGIYEYCTKIDARISEFLAADVIRTKMFMDVVNNGFQKIDSEESFTKVNQQLKNNEPYKLIVTKIIKSNVSLAKGISESIKDIGKSIIDKPFLSKIGWTGANCIKFEGTPICELIISKYNVDTTIYFCFFAKTIF